MSRQLPVAPRARRWAVVLVYAAVTLASSVVDPGPGPERTLFGVGRSISIHFVTYTGLAALVGYALQRTDRRGLLVAAGVAVCYGLAVELVQAPLPYRTASLLDGVVTVAGAAVGVLLWRAVARQFGLARASDGTTSI